VGSSTASQQHPVDRVQDEVAARFLRQVWDEIERLFAPQHVILFGSRAMGRARPDSDIDLILVSSAFEGVEFIKRLGIFRRQIDPLRYGISVDALCYTPGEFEVMGTGIGMVAEAAKEGIWLR
jgi:predicted nucleotidyltransferase